MTDWTTSCEDDSDELLNECCLHNINGFVTEAWNEQNTYTE